jgi:hypothetical protein
MIGVTPAASTPAAPTAPPRASSRMLRTLADGTQKVCYVFDPECYLVREKDETVPRVKTVEGEGKTSVEKVTHKKTGRRIKSYYGLTVGFHEH